MTLLFGAAVLLTLVVTLTFPWIQMADLSDQVLRRRAEQIASIAFDYVFDVGSADWPAAESRLGERWPVYQKHLGLKSGVPDIISREEVQQSGRAPETGFVNEAVDHLNRRTNEAFYSRFQEDGDRYRLAMAVRSPPTDPHPEALRGIIDVNLEVQTTERAWNFVATLLGGACGAALALLVFYIVINRLVLSSVSALRRVAEQVTNGDLSVRAGLKTGDEFQQLAETFNEMLAHLARNEEELRRINRSLDIKLGELVEANVALYESNRLKSEFLANVSHELRTPLASIIGFAELSHDMWDAPGPDPTRGRRYAHNILTSGRALLDIINDLLDLAKVEAGKMELHVSDFKLASVCEDSVDFLRPLADKKRIDMKLSLADDLPVMRSDSGKIKQILCNLLSNAVKFTPAEGRVTMEARRDGDARVELRVSDTGPGIAAEQVGAIFEKFRQLDSSKTREYEGTGLGLAITRELTHILGGTISLDSAVGQGATFIVRLPVTAPGPAGGGGGTAGPR